MSNIIIVRVRGNFHVSATNRGSLETLKLSRKNRAVIMQDSPSLQGVLRKLKSDITWGPVTDDFAKKMEAHKRKDGTFALNPPKGGYGRKGIKTHYLSGGAAGLRGEDIITLVERMI